MNTLIKSQLRNNTSALAYRDVDVSSADYVPSTIFKGLHVITTGNVAIKGVDDVIVIMPLDRTGTWSYGGKAIMSSGTTATFKVLF